MNRQPLGEFLGNFIRTLNPGNLTILEISDSLRCYAHAAIRAKLEKIAPSVSGVNLWVAGFSYHEQTPSLVEVFWQEQKTTLVTDENRSLPTAVVSGGDGKNQIDAVDWHKIVGKTTAQVRAYHRSLMDQAMRAPTAYNSVGGDIQEVVVTPSRWQWLHPPKGL